MTRKTLIQISDLHLSRARAYTYRNWQAVLTYINRTQPDLVVNTGDFVLDAPEDVEDLDFACQEMARLAVPWKALPGDHDIGGGPPAPNQRPDVPWLAQYATTEARREQYLRRFAEDCWALPFGDWYLIGVNDLIFESGLPAEAQQWQFMADHIMTAAGRPLVLFMHKPPCVTSMFEVNYVTNTIPEQARGRLRALLQQANTRLICVGHLHVYRTFQTIGTTVVVAPSLLRGHNDYASDNGLPVNGLVEYAFDGEGVEFRLAQPPGTHHLHLPDGARRDWPPLQADALT